MKLFVLTAMIFLSAASVIAGCFEDFRGLQDKSKVSIKRIREIEIKTKKDLKKLDPAEIKAVENYISYMNFTFVDDFTLYVTNEQYQTKDQHKSSRGYRITVTNGGDESTVRYYIKTEVGLEDMSYPILLRVWDNQSPERDFLCQGY